MLVYSHWTDRCGIARKNNWGSRMDYFLTSKELKPHVIDVKYQSQIEGSDHCPVTIELDFTKEVKHAERSSNKEQEDAGEDEEVKDMAAQSE